MTKKNKPIKQPAEPILNGYKTIPEFARNYVGKRSGKAGVYRQYIYDLVNQEKQKPGSTLIEFVEISGHTFVRYKN